MAILIDCHRVDQRILKHMVDSGAEFLMEVTDKTKADVKVAFRLFFLHELLVHDLSRVEHSLTTRGQSVSLRSLKFPLNTSKISKLVSEICSVRVALPHGFLQSESSRSLTQTTCGSISRVSCIIGR